jgi:hypothetical protein
MWLLGREPSYSALAGAFDVRFELSEQDIEAIRASTEPEHMLARRYRIERRPAQAWRHMPRPTASCWRRCAVPGSAEPSPADKDPDQQTACFSNALQPAGGAEGVHATASKPQAGSQNKATKSKADHGVDAPPEGIKLAVEHRTCCMVGGAISLQIHGSQMARSGRRRLTLF